MVTVKEILEKNNLNLKLNQGLLDLDIGNKDYKFVDMYIEHGDTFHGLNTPVEATKVFNFESSDGHKLEIYPDESDYCLWLTTDYCYYNENGEFTTKLNFDYY